MSDTGPMVLWFFFVETRSPEAFLVVKEYVMLDHQDIFYLVGIQSLLPRLKAKGEWVQGQP